MPAIVVIFLLVGGSAAGFMFMRSSNTVESKQSNPTQTNSLADKAVPETKTETTPQPVAEKMPEANVVPATSLVPDSDKAPSTQSSFKNKPAVPVPNPRVVKPNTPPAKAPANQKKAVTVDDIINGN